jgi:hypothetical protein
MTLGNPAFSVIRQHTIPKDAGLAGVYCIFTLLQLFCPNFGMTVEDFHGEVLDHEKPQNFGNLKKKTTASVV